jgi:hypothetical protein
MLASVVHRPSAFTTTPGRGNPAGVWVGDALPDAPSTTVDTIAFAVWIYRFIPRNSPLAACG